MPSVCLCICMGHKSICMKDVNDGSALAVAASRMLCTLYVWHSRTSKELATIGLGWWRGGRAGSVGAIYFEGRIVLSAVANDISADPFPVRIQDIIADPGLQIIHARWKSWPLHINVQFQYNLAYIVKGHAALTVTCSNKWHRLYKRNTHCNLASAHGVE